AESVQLKKKGRLFWGCCPFHSEKTPSFKIDPGTQLWHCFGCGVGGDAFGYVMRTESLEFPDAVRALADRARIEIVEEGGGLPRGLKERLMAALEETAEFYHKHLLSSREAGPAAARDYLSARGFTSEVAKEFQLGYAAGRGALTSHLTQKGFSADELVKANVSLKDERTGRVKDRFYERVMFPIRDLSGRCVGFGGRVVGQGEPKYLNTQETPVFHKSRNLYAIDRAKNEIVSSKPSTAVVVEGYTDVIAMHEAGIKNTVATLGTALTAQHVKLLSRFAKRVVYLFDGDEAGMRAADRAAEFIDSTLTPEAGSSKIDLGVALIPDGKDPADYVGSSGADAMRDLIESAVPLLQFVIDRRMDVYDLTKPEERIKALHDAAGVLAAVKESILAHDYANYIADRLQVDFNTVQQAIKVAKPQVGRASEAESRGEDAPVQTTSAFRDPQSQIEMELLGVVAAYPVLRSKARGLLVSDLLVNDTIKRALEAITAVAGAERDDLYRAVAAADPESAAVVSGVLVDDRGQEDVDFVVRELLSKLKEFALERLIKEKKAHMKSLDPVKDKGAYDDLFRETGTLEVQVHNLRRGVGAPDPDQEVWG
ncbi:MAG: DNA primase, partial [Actinomycetota bacterium]|nr:DNA primase [Actinomycetota bacterium]